LENSGGRIGALINFGEFSTLSTSSTTAINKDLERKINKYCNETLQLSVLGHF
jgi:hypothetical protein